MKLLFVFILFTFSLCSNAEKLKVVDIPIDFIGKGSDGSDIKISDYRGKVVIVSFWASWCGPCRKELPVLSGIQKKATAQKLQVISINIDSDRSVFRKLVKAIGETSLKFVHDPRDRISDKFGAEAIPYMVIINPQGTIAAIHMGYNETELPALVEEINEISRQRPAS